MSEVVAALLGLAGGIALARAFTGGRAAKAATAGAPPAPDTEAPPTAPAVAAAATPASAEPDERSTRAAVAAAARERLYQLAESLGERFHQSAHPADLLDDARFRDAALLLQEEAFDRTELMRYVHGPNQVLACVALRALAERKDGADAAPDVLAALNGTSFWARWFGLRLLEQRSTRPIVADLLVAADESWQHPFPEQFLAELVQGRIANGEHVALDERLLQLPGSRLEWLQNVLAKADPKLGEALRERRERQPDLAFLRGFARLWTAADAEQAGATLLETPVLQQRADSVLAALTRAPGRSVVLVGEPGVGKTSALRFAARRLLRDGWTLFEAGAVELLAGQQFMGQLEQRLQGMLQAVAGKPRVAWIVPDLQELVWAGRHQHGRTSVLDVMLPHVEAGRLLLLAEVEPAAWQRLLLAKPELRGAVEALQLAPLGAGETLAMGRAWARLHGPRTASLDAAAAQGDAPSPLVDEPTLDEAWRLSQQYLGDKAPPGNLLQLLDAARQAHVRDGQPHAPIRRAELLATLGRLTGLPRTLLDDRQALDLAGLRAFFHRRVLGQPEAVECLVERVAMMKAGLTDPNRPQGVFLFCGPTGTGKTELAKALGEWLFGSPQRLVRIDMSELQAPDAINRILGDADPHGDGDGGRTALVHAIRKQPFAVVLLDELEKAHPSVWDLFLQVFDDGRLSDRRGRLADFRHAIVIMTSNLGAVPTRASGIAFAPGAAQQQFTGGAPAPATHAANEIADSVARALERELRPEFLNRIDRVVVFQPLGRNVMRAVLDKELEGVLQRRGLRHRQWAVEWDESAREFLLAKGFSPSLGARPLRRAIERYLLSPLALTIVEHQVPEGDQFLFVRADGRSIQVEFIDPDAPDVRDASEGAGAAAGTAGPPAKASLRLQHVLLEAEGSRDEVELLQRSHASLAGVIAAADWRERKAAALATIAEPDFWSRPERFAVLARAEYMDRIEQGLRTGERLLHRLLDHGAHRARFAPDVVQAAAGQFYLLQSALDGLAQGLAADAWLEVRAGRGPRSELTAANAFAGRLAHMYRAWAGKRRMDFAVLDETPGSAAEPFRARFAVGGYGAFAILRHEQGLHVLEADDQAGRRQRHRVHVTVAPQADGPAAADAAALLAQAAAALGAAQRARPRVARRYRGEPSPLVRDAVRGWRSGRYDRVLGGDFDLVD